MLKATKMGDVELMKNIIVSNDTLKISEVWLSIVDKKGRSALHIAAINRSLTVVRFIANEIISTIPDIQIREQYFNAPDEKGRTPLFFSAALGFLDITKLLLNRGVNIDARTNAFHPAPGSTPLMATAEKGHVKCFAALMDSGADIFEQRLDGADALYLATREGRKQIIEMIVNTDKIASSSASYMVVSLNSTSRGRYAIKCNIFISQCCNRVVIAFSVCGGS